MDFNKNGTLEPGIHEMVWEDFHHSFSFSPRRKELLQGLEKVVTMLREIGAEHIYIDGSFVTDKPEPNDWDACFTGSLDMRNELMKIFPLYERHLQKLLYNGELSYAYDIADENDTIFLDFFQKIKDKRAKKKGIVKINL